MVLLLLEMALKMVRTSGSLETLGENHGVKVDILNSLDMLAKDMVLAVLLSMLLTQLHENHFKFLKLNYFHIIIEYT